MVVICGVQQVENVRVICLPFKRPLIVTSHQELVPPMQVKGFGLVTSCGVRASAAQARAGVGMSPPAGLQSIWKTARPTHELSATTVSCVFAEWPALPLSADRAELGAVSLRSMPYPAATNATTVRRPIAPR